MKPRILDLFSGAGGSAVGYFRAGFDVVGVDSAFQKHYPFPFLQREAVSFLMGLVNDTDCAAGWRLSDFDAIHASPPCQGYTLMRGLGGKAVGKNTPRLIPEVRRLLLLSGKPFVIENVPGAPLHDPVTLCGSMFGLGVRRHRRFETSWPLSGLKCNHNEKWPVAVWGGREHQGPIAVYGDHPEDSPIHRRDQSKPGLTRRAATLKVAQDAMGIDWMDWRELCEAIPPAYTQHVGLRLRAIIDKRREP